MFHSNSTTIETVAYLLELRIDKVLDSDNEIQKNFKAAALASVNQSEIIENNMLELVIVSGAKLSIEERNKLFVFYDKFPNALNVLFETDHAQRKQIKTIVIIPNEWSANLIGSRKFFALGGFLDEYNKTIYLSDIRDARGSLLSAMVGHELFHEWMWRESVNVPVLLDEGFGELILESIRLNQKGFIESPQETLIGLVNNSPFKLLGRKADIGTPLLPPVIYSIKKDGGYIDWVREQFVHQGPISREKVLKWLVVGEFRDQKYGSTALQVELDYCVGKAIVISMIRNGHSPLKVLKLLSNSFSSNTEEKALEIFNLAEKSGIDLVKSFMGGMELVKQNLKINYICDNNAIVKKYLEAIEPIYNGCTREEAEIVMKLCGITWK
ncbi:MAG: hypothetical protein ACD_19C00430G0003 [uncultured bacterium]|uniref:Uncharacterized protein n=1 Tax=candidate division WWE3 bacterium RIFCSPLOWO2_01_FULL_37_15 TaxID=1802622 RepID=A0A1F4UT37_UNCKA|nr:MAG: hypothetical protein ACD_19C00430G0003 [uncultured bacterium]OGC48124.1 MAG: hypothetical protein A3A69_00825 [candidate division WWE3 bacterium RIFCSPLOWO2_01_FULL_37_15]